MSGRDVHGILSWNGGISSPLRFCCLLGSGSEAHPQQALVLESLGEFGAEARLLENSGKTFKTLGCKTIWTPLLKRASQGKKENVLKLLRDVLALR